MSDPARIEHLDPEVARILRGKSGMERLRLAHIAGILAVSGPDLDVSYISQWAHRLGVLDLWEVTQRR